MEERLLALLQEVFSTIGWWGVVFLMGLESAGIPIPSELIMPLSGWMLIKERGLGLSHLLLAGFYGAVGNLGGSLLAYWIGLKGGRPFLEKYGRWVLITPHDLAWADRWFAKYGDATVFFSRLMPVVRTFISFPAGISRSSLPRFILFTLLGSFPWSLALAYGGFLLGENWERVRGVMRPVELPLIALALVVGGWFLYRRIRGLRRQGG